MSRKSEIFNFIVEQSRKDLSKNDGFTTKEICEAFDMNRSAVSRELNSLVRERKLKKQRGKPVIYSIVANEKNDNALLDENNSVGSVFSNFIGSSGSMEVQVNLAKAAIMYPPNGLNTIILGSTGVGKTTFAKIMYQYAKEIGRLDDESPFIHFNCADYSNNPQLLLSVLFGHAKGAFTGAESDKEGLIEQANHGILFLDEVHRLPPEGQEMLFSIIDTKKYRRLGESGKSSRKAEILILCATTENIESTLLQTFKRRFPLTLTLPDLKDRDLSERLQLIDYYFILESKKIDFEINVKGEVIQYLSSYDCDGNIGQLKNDIQILCAKEFANAMVNKTSYLEISADSLSVQESRNSLQNNQFDDITYYHGYKKTEFKDDGDALSLRVKIDHESSFYKSILEKYSTFLREGKSIKEIQNKITYFLSDFFEVDLQKGKGISSQNRNKGIEKLVSKEILEIVDETMSEISEDLNITCNSYVSYNLALHIEALVLKLQTSSFKYHPKKNFEKTTESRLKKYADKLIERVNKEMGVNIPTEEQDIIELFLDTIYKDVQKNPIGILIVMHGQGIATNLAKMVNSLLGIQHVVGINMPLDDSIENVYQKVLDVVKLLDRGAGVILMVDMGSLTSFQSRLVDDLGIKVKVIDNVTSPMVIEITRKALFTDLDLEHLVSEVLEENNYYMINRKNTNIFDHSSRRIIRNNDYLFYHSLEQSVNFLNVHPAVQLLNDILITLAEQYNFEIIDTLVIKFYFHCLGMIERAIRKEQLNFEIDVDDRNELFFFIKKELNTIERTYGVELTDGEILYVTKIINAFI